MIISVVQFKTEGVEDIRGRGLSFIEDALKEGPDLVVLQELFTTIYFPQYKDEDYFQLAEEIPGKTTDAIYRIIKSADVAVVAPIFEKYGSEYYCSAAVIDSGSGYLGTYRKLHIPTFKHIHESYYFKGGNLGHRIFQTNKASIGIMLCYDRHFPESARIYGLNNVDIVIVSSATPKSSGKVWFLELQAHAFSNCFSLACSNRSGTEDKIEFLGKSFICNHNGEILAQAGKNSNEIITAEVDIEAARKARNESVFYKDRRPDLYKGISR